MENIDKIIDLFESRKHELYYYSPYSFLKSIDKENLFNNSVKSLFIQKIENQKIQVITNKVDDQEFHFLVEYLEWDSNYFNFPTYRLHTVLFKNEDSKNLEKAISLFIKQFFDDKSKYCITDIPSEDIYMLQGLTGAGFRLIETRMTYYLDLNKINFDRYNVREANFNDIPNLRRIAFEMRNPYDRFHADSIFNSEKADEFLAAFIEESIKGFADYTMVPNEAGTPPDAFLTAKYLIDEWPLIGAKVSKMVLSAVSSKTCKGWYKKLISEMAFHLKTKEADFAFMHPASTNKAVIHTYETLGCKLGQVSHVFSFNLKD